MHISAKITGIKYKPFLCRELKNYIFSELNTAIIQNGSFLLKIDEENQIAASWWTSAKRSRTYPYARVYDSLSFQGKKITIIPIYKDEGKKGDRDYLQWDTISSMSLLGVYTIISYYVDAEPNPRKEEKITEQRFDTTHIKSEIKHLLSYQSDALHWNLSQVDKVGEIGRRALDAYIKISEKLGIEMHSTKFAEKRIQNLLKSKEVFMHLSRDLAEKAQHRESITIQPKEKLSGTKATLTIKNYLGGYYYFTSDEVIINKQDIYLIEGKHTKDDKLPSLTDIKDGLWKMILFTNLEDVRVEGEKYNPVPVLKLTTGSGFRMESLNEMQIEMLKLLKQESIANNFKIMINKNVY
ncbi:MAG TPA: hypothetical protein DCX95_04090 [Elusimicrobia bacterium]|nr:hypothetical protein [Elusimicrobiota bacterium]